MFKMSMPQIIASDDPADDNPYNDGPNQEEEKEAGVLLKTRPKVKKPDMYKVLLLNDDYTPMEFVVEILEKFFNKNKQESTDIMLHVHRIRYKCFQKILNKLSIKPSQSRQS